MPQTTVPQRSRVLSFLPADISIRWTTGFFALLIVVIVAAMGLELIRESMLSIRKFGFDF